MNKYHWLLLAAYFITAISQILLNISIKKNYKSRLFEYLNPLVIISYILLTSTILISTYVLRFIPMKESIALSASVYIFVLALSRLILKEPITLKKIIGNIIIIIGILVFVY